MLDLEDTRYLAMLRDLHISEAFHDAISSLDENADWLREYRQSFTSKPGLTESILADIGDFHSELFDPEKAFQGQLISREGLDTLCSTTEGWEKT